METTTAPEVDMTWATQPMTGLALATTMADPARARVVAVSIRTVNTGQAATGETHIVNTPVEIPAAATAIHGYAAAETTTGISPTAAVATIIAALHDAATHARPVVIFNAQWFFQVLANEARSIGMTYELPVDLHLIDPLVIDAHINPARRAGNRTLPALAQAWLVDSAGHGTPTANVTLALRIAWRIGTKYPRVGTLTPAALHAAQAQWKREFDDERTTHFASRGMSAPADAARAA